MFKHIMAPIDLGALDKLEHAMAVTADAAKHYGAKVTYVSATNTVPTSVAHTPEEFQEKLEKVATAEAERHGLEADAHALVLHDTSADLDRHLVDTERGARRRSHHHGLARPELHQLLLGVERRQGRGPRQGVGDARPRALSGAPASS